MRPLISSLSQLPPLLLLLLGSLALTGCPDPEDKDDDQDGFTENEGDCDDANAAIFPGAPDVVCDGIDSNCLGDNEDDQDGDGVTACDGDDPFDCDDEDASVFPGNDEECDEVDHDCDGDPRNGLPEFTWWIDADGDGYGAGDLTITCENVSPGDEYVSADDVDEDCDDDDDGINPDATETCDGIDEDCSGVADDGLGDNEYWEDADGDGVGDEDSSVLTCNPEAPEGYVLPTPGTSDCDDADADNYPGNTEVCDAADNDCDAIVDNGFDVDGDSVTTCGPDGTPGNADDDCDDALDTVFPGATETCDGVDEDCDGTVDNGFDADGDGVNSCGADGTPGNADDDCDDANAAVFPGATELCDGIDGDCDGSLPADEVDDDGDLYVECFVPVGTTINGILGGDDCDDTQAGVNPGATEVCDGLDSDCSGVVPADELDVDGDSWLACIGFSDLGVGFSGGGDCDDSLASGAAVSPAAAEACDGIDNDCDTGVDEDFDDDFDTYFDGADAGCVATYPSTDCDDLEPLVNPDAAELCDGIDNDCDTLVDALDTSDFTGSDNDGDGDAGTACGGTDCDDTDPLINGFDNDQDLESACAGDCDDADPTVASSAPESCDGLDNDCDGVVDNNVLADADGDGFDAAGCGIGGTDCMDNDQHVFPDETYTSGFQRQCAPAVRPGYVNTWYTGRLNLPSYFLDPQTGTHYLYFRGHHDPTYHQIGYASSADGVTWGGVEGPVLSENPVAGSFDGRRISHPSVAYIPGKARPYIMAYHAQEDSPGVARTLGIATAETAEGDLVDGTFKRLDLGGVGVAAPIVTSSASVTAGDNEQVIHPALWFDPLTDLLHVWYTGRFGSPNQFVIVHASCDTTVSDCGAESDWVKTDSNGDGDPDLWLEGAPGGWDDDDVRQAFVMTHSDPTGFFGYDLEVWYTGNSDPFGSIGYLQGDKDSAASWTTAEENPIFAATTSTDRYDSESVTGRGVRYDATTDAYHMYYGTSVTLPTDGNGEGIDPLWGPDNYSSGASYIGHAINAAPEVAINASSCTSLSGTVTDNAPDTVSLEIFDGASSILGPIFPDSTGNSNVAVQSTTWTAAVSLAAGSHTVTVLATDAAGAERSSEVTLTCP